VTQQHRDQTASAAQEVKQQVTKENKKLVLILVAVFAGVSLLLCCPNGL
jgi:hypothetical protein